MMKRRQFVKTTAAATAALSFPFVSRMGMASPNEEVRIAVIGVGGRGDHHISQYKGIDGVRIVALCDADSDRVQKATEKLNKDSAHKAEAVVDFRDILSNKNIDAISIATPNHWHSLMGIWGVQAGKDVYVEKPVSQNVWEGRQLVNAANNSKQIVQTGTQSRSSIKGIKEAVEYVRAGNLGKIQYAVGTCYKPRKSIGKLDSPLKIPAGLDYDLWCGPAAMVDIYRPKLHYDWHWDFNTGNGDIGNQGVHQLDIARWFLGEEAVSPQIFSMGGRFGYEDAADTPNTQVVCHLYEKAPLIFEVRGLPHDKAAQKQWKEMDSFRGSRVGVIVQCEGGSVLIPSYTQAIIRDNDDKQVKKFSGAENNFANFIDAVRTRNSAELNAPILEGHISAAMCHTGNISHRLGSEKTGDQIAEQIKSDKLTAESFARMEEHLRRNDIDITSASITLGPVLTMDPKTERFTNNEEANKLLSRDPRKPFTVPEVPA